MRQNNQTGREKMLSENLNNAVSNISSILKSCDMKKIEAHCLALIMRKMENNTPDDCRIFSYLISIKNEPLNDRLSLPSGIFCAVDKI
jgi:hypothetical protein